MADDFSEKIKIFQNYMKEWEERGGSTIMDYTRFIKEFFNFVQEKFGITKVEDIQSKHMIEWMKELKNNGNSSSTINTKRWAICKLFVALNHYEPDNKIWLEKLTAFKHIKTIGKVNKIQHEPLPQKLLPILKESAWRLYEKWGITDYYAWFYMMLYTSCRSQFYGLKVSEVDLENGVIRTKVKGEQPREIPIHPELKKVLEWHLKNRKYKSKYLFYDGKSPYVPNDPKKEKQNQNHNRKKSYELCKAIQREAGIKEEYVCKSCGKEFNRKTDRCDRCKGKVVKKGYVFVCEKCENVYVNKRRKCECGGSLYKKHISVYAHSIRETVHFYLYELRERAKELKLSPDAQSQLVMLEEVAKIMGGWSDEKMARYYARAGKHIKMAKKVLEKIDLLKIAEEA